MGRHIRTDPDAAALPGWGLYATLVAAVTLRWTGGTWSEVEAVTALGAGTTGVLWWTLGHAGTVRRWLGEAAATASAASRPCMATAQPADPPGVPRRVTP